VNTFNYLLSDFLTSNLSAAYGPDYFVVSKSLIVPLSSTWLLNVSSIQVLNKGVSALNLSNAPKLSSVTIQEPELISYQPPVTNTRFLCAAGFKGYSLTITGSNMDFYAVVNCPELRNINFGNIRSVRNIVVSNNPKLSGISLVDTSFAFICASQNYTFAYNNLTNESCDNIYESLWSGSLSGSAWYPNTTVTIINPVTGTKQDLVNAMRQFTNYFTFNLERTSQPLVENITFATKV